MAISIAEQAVALKQFQVRTSAQIAVIKKQNEMSKLLIQMIDDATRNAPLPAGQGTRLDKTA